MGQLPLQKKITLILAVVVLLPCVLLCAIVSHYMEVAEKSKQEQQYITQLRAAEDAVNQGLLQVENIIDVLAKNSDIKYALTAHSREVDMVLSLLFHGVREMDNSEAYLGAYRAEILLISPNDQVLESYYYLYRQSVYEDDAELMAFLNSEKRRAWLMPHANTDKRQRYTKTGECVISYYQKVYSGLSSYMGTVQCSVRIDSIFAPLTELTPYGTVRVWQGDHCIYQVDSTGSKTYPDGGDTPEAGCTRLSSNSAVQAYRMTLDIPDAVLNQSGRSILGFSITLLVLIYLPMVVVTGMVIKALLRKLNFVIDAMSAIDLTQKQLRIPSVDDNEVGRLVHSINRVFEKLDRQHDEILRGEQDKRIYESAALQFQMNPHMLFNALHWLQLKLDSREAIPQVRETIRLLGEVYRYNLSSNSIATLREETEHIHSYVLFMRGLKDSAIHLTVTCPQELHPMRVPRFTLQPLVENAIKHGKSKDRPLHIEVTCAQVGDKVEVSVKNDGLSMTAERLAVVQARLLQPRRGEQAHIGLSNLAQRLRLLYEGAAAMEITAEDGHTLVAIHIPYENGEV
ncbi:histidine kinase [Ruminococcaceae bacterium OttesenSCG-928-L11]|nr:histidine kinase [Ruminococcaceae bacterium OttesenSCG-928-L11]